MNIKSAISFIMYKFFGIIAFLGFLISFCVSDIPKGQGTQYIEFFFSCVVCSIISIMFYNKNIILRHVSALLNVILLMYGLTFKKTSSCFKNLYLVASRCCSIRSFYNYCLAFYDHEVDR